MVSTLRRSAKLSVASASRDRHDGTGYCFLSIIVCRVSNHMNTFLIFFSV